MARLRIVFMGTPELAAVCLQALLREPAFEIIAVVTQPDRPKGRDLKLQPSPVKQLALACSIPVLQPEKARDEKFLSELKDFSPELIAVAAFGQILPRAMLELPRHGCLNVHTSLLPKYRGAAPIQWAIANGDAETGVTIMKMDVGLDTGDILTQRTTPIAPGDNSQTLHDRLAKLGGELLVQTIPDYVAGKIIPQSQIATLATHAAKIKKEDGHINWNLPARVIWNRLRAFTPWPGGFTFLATQPQPTLLKILSAEVAEKNGASGQILSADKSGIVVGCGEGALRILNLQREGGRRLTAPEFLAGHPLSVGEKLGP
ncbi:MAG: methionyl-tRNA formyltransferase [Verrucomicrobia bacterium]|nr:MAG: methionyl-tRNA formyltransferase [Verrucomicrobiota bacterium]